MSRDRRPQAYKPGQRHGTTSAYSDGCRCERCAQAARDYRRLRSAGMRRPTPPPVPLAPLLERLSSYLGERAEQLDYSAVAEACGVSHRTVVRWMKARVVAVSEVDDIAVRLGWHPAAIWGAEWYCRTYSQEVAA